ncbi:MAG: hypothetical protein ABUL49_00235 [bacterium]
MERIAIEPELDKVVDAMGGIRVSTLVGLSPDFDNADYLFEAERVVAELKILEKDSFSDFAGHVKQAILGAIKAGKLPPPKPGKTIYETADLPFEDQRRVFEKLRGPLKLVIQKANKQIKATKKRLGLPDFQGVLFLANDGNTALEFATVLYLLSSLFFGLEGKRVFSGIDRVVYFTANLPATVPGVGVNSQVWAAPWLDKDDHRLDLFVNSLQQTWITHIESLSQSAIPVVNFGEDRVEDVRIRPKGVPVNSPQNQLLSKLFDPPDSLEQSLLDILGKAVYGLRGSACAGVEVARVVTRGPLAMKVFDAACNRSGVVSVYVERELKAWPGHVMVGIIVSRQSTQNLKDLREFQSEFLPFPAEVALVERAGELAERLKPGDSLSFCRLELAAEGQFDLSKVAPCLVAACTVAGLRMDVVYEGLEVRLELTRLAGEDPDSCNG